LIINEYNTIWAGDIRTLSSLPVESLMPIMFLKNMASMMNEFTITDEYIEFGYDPTSVAKSHPQGKIQC
jgi:hypothetical protein